MSGELGSLAGSLLVAVTVKEREATPDSASVAFTVATVTRVLFGGHSEHPLAGVPEITGGVLSILTEYDFEASWLPE